MAIGNRIRFIRKFRGMTQQQLGIEVGFSEKNADIRIAQYENGSRTPRDELNSKLAEVLEVSPAALNVPDIESELGVMHTLFALEDLYGLHIAIYRADGEIGSIVLKLSENDDNLKLRSAFAEWANERLRFFNGDISEDEYDNWRYTFGLEVQE